MKTTLIATLITLSTAVTALACSNHDKHAMSCAEGSVYDAEAGNCVPLASS